MRVDRSAPAEAKPSTVWAIISKLDWETWDPALKAIEDCEGLKEGATLTMVMKDGAKMLCAITECKENEHCLCVGSAVGGLMQFSLEFNLTPIDDNKTTVQYIFSLTGCLGSVFASLKKSMVVGDTEIGLANIVKFSEEKEKA